MIRTRTLYGVWAAVCAGLAGLPFVLPLDEIGGGATVGYASTLVGTTGIIAACGWEIFHRRGRQPSGWGYCLLAVLVVLVTHLLFFGAVAINSDDIAEGLMLLARPLILHAWFTIPIALLATFLFVVAQRRFTTAGPSGPSPARSRS